MTLMRKATTVLSATALLILLGGCVSVFPKTKPAQLYRFSITSAAEAIAPRGASIVKGPVEFTTAAATDRILTSDGSTVAYIAGARWVSSAPTLFDDALQRAFADAPAAPQLVGRRRAGSDVPVMTLDVVTFETRYRGGASPVVVVEVRAELIRPSDHMTLAEKTFQAQTPAADNRVGLIVSAYDASVSKVLGDLAAWTAQYAAAAPAG